MPDSNDNHKHSHASTALDNVGLINRLWWLHLADEGCFYFFVDRRFCLSDSPEPFEVRFGVSYGDNPFTEDMTKNVFVPPPYLPGPFLFGIHVVGVLKNQLTLYDQWFDSHAAGPERLQFEEAHIQATEILNGLTDDVYARHVGESGRVPELFRSSLFSLDEFEVVQGEAF